MCGIFGILFANSVTKPPENRLNQSSELISHRGRMDTASIQIQVLIWCMPSIVKSNENVFSKLDALNDRNIRA